MDLSLESKVGLLLGLSIVVIISYMVFIGLGSREIREWWFGMDEYPFTYSIFGVTVSSAAIGFVYLMYFVSDLEDTDLEKELLIEMIIILIASAFWAPVVSLSFNNHYLRYLAAALLGVVAFASLTLLIFLARSDKWTWVSVSAASAFLFHVFFIDFIWWNYHYVGKHLCSEKPYYTTVVYANPKLNENRWT